MAHGKSARVWFVAATLLSVAVCRWCAGAPLPAQGMRLWLKADAIEGLADGQGVALWKDSSTAGADAAQDKAESQPKFVADGIGGKPAVQFDGADDFFRVAGTPLKGLTAFEVFLVIRTPPADTEARAVMTVNDNPKAFSVNCRSQYFVGTYDRDANYKTVGVMIPAKVSSNLLVDLIHNAPQRRSKGRTNEMSVFAVNENREYVADTTFDAAMTLGAPKTGTDLAIAEIVIYDRELSEEERGVVEAGLSEKYGLKVTPLEALPKEITGALPNDCVATMGMEFLPAKAQIASPKPSVSDKRLHGRNIFVSDGSVSTTPDGILLKGTEKPSWASPQVWSGLKNVLVTARLKVDNAGQGATFGLKFGSTWAISVNGPRLVLSPGEGAISFPGAGKAAESAKVAVPVGEWFTLTGWYSFEGETFEAAVNGAPALKVAMPREPFEAFMERFERPAPVTGIGVFAEGCDVTVGEFSFLAGAPKRRIVVMGDSITQQAYWVMELEKALGEKVTNVGIGGDAAKMMIDRFARDVLPLEPKIVILFGGTNDIGWGSAPQAVAGSFMATMVRQAKAAGIRPILCEILPRRGMAQKIPLYNAEIRKLAEAQSVPLLAWHDALLDPEKGEMKDGYAPDGTHPARAGGAAMVKAVDLSAVRP